MEFRVEEKESRRTHMQVGHNQCQCDSRAAEEADHEPEPVSMIVRCDGDMDSILGRGFTGTGGWEALLSAAVSERNKIRKSFTMPSTSYLLD